MVPEVGILKLRERIPNQREGIIGRRETGKECQYKYLKYV